MQRQSLRLSNVNTGKAALGVTELPNIIVPHKIHHDDDIVKLDRLQLINASARFELLSANQQLLDFHLNRIVNNKGKFKGGAAAAVN